jgi:hypothetical protein
MERTASRQAWRVVLGALMVLALIGVPGGFVGAKEKPHSEEAATESPAPDSSQEEADSGQSSQTSPEDESATQEDESPTESEEATETDSSADGSESGSAESTGGGESNSSSHQARTSKGGQDQPDAECPEGTEFLVKFEWNGTAFVPEGGDPKGVTITDVVLDEEGEPTSVSFTSEVEIAVVAVKTGGGTTFVTINGTSGTVSSPDVHAISHLTFCVPAEEPPPPPPPADITVDLVKDNDADEDGTFTDSEEASEEGQDVTFQVVITNTSDVPVMIMSLTDAFGDTVIDPLECLTAEGKNVIGMWLDPDESVTCTFTVQDYAPPAGATLVDTVEVTVCEKGSDDRASDSDTSEVTSPEEGPPPPPPPADITVELVKDNDADEDGTFTDSEEASDEGQDVTFQVVITNTSDVAVEILSLSDAFGEFVFDPIACLTSERENVIGMVLDPGESVTCTFTILNYAPPAEERLVDTVEVVVGEEGNEENQASDSDTSVVTTAEVLGGIVTPPRPGVQPPAQPGAQVAALAVTGAELAWMAFLAATLLITGAVLIYTTQRRSRKQRA